MDAVMRQLVSFEAQNAFFTAFSKSFLVILASEIGDKTFFIAMVMAMKSSKILVCL